MKLSLILPSLNVVDYIKTCIESALAQTLFDMEIICVDAGSTDGTLEIIKEYQARKENEGRILLIESPVKSYGYQVNLGIEKAKGEYVGILETDDFVNKKMFATLVQFADENSLDYAKANYDEFYERRDGQCMFLKSNTPYVGILVNPSIMQEIFVTDMSLWRGVYRRSFLIENHIRLNETPGASYQDIGFSMQVFSKANRALYMDDSFYRYRKTRLEASSNSIRTLQYIKQEYDFIRDLINSGSQLYEKAILNRIITAFLSEYEQLVVNDKINYRSSEFTQNVYWFKKLIERLTESGEWPFAETKEDTVNIVRKLLYMQDSYVEELRHRKEKVNIIKTELREVISSLEDSNIIIFGAGAYGKMYLKELFLADANIIGFCDNNQELWGRNVEGLYTTDYAGADANIKGLPIYSPKQAIEISKLHKSYFFIANKSNGEDIKMQLLNCGVVPEQIIWIENMG